MSGNFSIRMTLAALLWASLVVNVVGQTPANGSAARTWTSADGKFKVVAKLIEFADGKVVLEKEDGLQVTVPLERISQADQEFLQQVARPGTAPAPSTKTEPAKNSPSPMPETRPAPESEPATEEPPQPEPRQRTDAQELAYITAKDPVLDFELAASLKLDIKLMGIGLSADATMVCTCEEDGTCRVWDVASGEKLGAYEQKVPGKYFEIAFSPDGAHVLVFGTGEGVIVWEIKSGKHKFTHDASAARTSGISTSGDGQLAVFTDGANVFAYPLFGGRGGGRNTASEEVYDVAASPTGDFVILHQRETREEVLFLGREEDVALNDQRIMFPVWGMRSQSHAELSLDGKHYLTVYSDGNVDLWTLPDLALKEFYIEFERGFRPTWTAVARDGQSVAFANKVGDIQVWKIPSRWTHPQMRLVEVINDNLRAANYARIETLFSFMESGKLGPQLGIDRKYVDRAILMPPLNPVQRLEMAAKWLDAEPEAVWPRVIMARYFLKLASLKRGGGAINTVSEEDLREFIKFVSVAQELVQGYEEQDNLPADAFGPLFEVALYANWERERIDRCVEKMMKVDPQNNAHGNVILKRLERWGGKPGDAVEYATRQADKLGGDAGDELYARLAMLLYDMFPGPNAFFEELKFDKRRILNGLPFFIAEVRRDPGFQSALPLGQTLARELDDKEFNLHMGRILNPPLASFKRTKENAKTYPAPASSPAAK